jgi:uncharacterized protein with PCYCGC motif
MAAAESVMTRLLVVIVVAAVMIGGAAAWWIASASDPITQDAIGDSVQTRGRGQMPAFADRGDTPDLYRFAVDHPEILTFMPCTCGCGGLGHTSNRSCYVKAETPDRVTFTSHAAT